MRYFLLSVILVYLINCQAQDKGSNLISLDCGEEKSEDLFMFAGKLLKGKGYSFDNVDKDFFTLSTEEDPITKGQIMHRVFLSVTGSSIDLRAKVKVGGVTQQAILGHNSMPYEPAANKGMKTSMYRAGWQLIDNIALEIMDLKGCSVLYLKE